MSRSFLTLILFVSLIISQDHASFYNGELSFSYSGAMNGTFYANLDNPDSLSIASSGAFCIINSDSVSNRIIIPAFQPSPNLSSAIDLFILYMTSDGTEIDPQQWDVVTPDPTNLENTSATMLFIPEVDSSQVMGIIAPLLNGEVDSTNFSDFLLETIAALITDSFLPLSGEIVLDAIDESDMSGGFSGTLFQTGFPPPIVFITNGSFTLTAPAGQLQPSPPVDFTIQLVESDAYLQWNFAGVDSLLNFTTVHKLAYLDSGMITINIEVPFPETEFFDTDIEPMIDYEYFLTVTNILGMSSEPTETISFYFETNLLGDLNMDGDINVLDIVTMVNFVLGADTPTDYEMWAGDLNSDGNLDVLDIVTIVNIILEDS
ncbi:MAG: hypothetical protein HQ510_10905 [Candidatus Marinimicrobia bacterium]|nr:hypothetical protein [Candidatus Neomarinimicrobiota bacterium]